MPHIDNASGHYAPNRQALYNAVNIISHESAVLDYLRVGVTRKDRTLHYAGPYFSAARWRRRADSGLVLEPGCDLTIYRAGKGFLPESAVTVIRHAAQRRMQRSIRVRPSPGDAS